MSDNKHVTSCAVYGAVPVALSEFCELPSSCSPVSMLSDYPAITNPAKSLSSVIRNALQQLDVTVTCHIVTCDSRVSRVMGDGYTICQADTPVPVAVTYRYCPQRYLRSIDLKFPTQFKTMLLR